MLPEIKEELLRVLESAKEAIKNQDVTQLKELSNSIIHTTSIYQDSYSTSIAVLIYSISKLYERTSYRESKSWSKCCNIIETNLNKSILALKQDKIEDFEALIQDILKNISRLDPKLRKNIREVFYKARINKASRLYEHGISIGRTSSILNITPWELLEYAGKTGISEKGITLDIKERLKLARSLFK